MANMCEVFNTALMRKGLIEEKEEEKEKRRKKWNTRYVDNEE